MYHLLSYFPDWSVGTTWYHCFPKSSEAAHFLKKVWIKPSSEPLELQAPISLEKQGVNPWPHPSDQPTLAFKTAAGAAWGTSRSRRTPFCRMETESSPFGPQRIIQVIQVLKVIFFEVEPWESPGDMGYPKCLLVGASKPCLKVEYPNQRPIVFLTVFPTKKWI